LRWCSAQVPEIRRGRILPRSGMKPWSSFTSFQSMYSSFSAQNLQTLRRRTKNFLPAPSVAAGRARGPLRPASAHSHDSLLSAGAASAAGSARRAGGGRLIALIRSRRPSCPRVTPVHARPGRSTWSEACGARRPHG
jgi:hypothetical protein